MFENHINTDRHSLLFARRAVRPGFSFALANAAAAAFAFPFAAAFAVSLGGRATVASLFGYFVAYLAVGSRSVAAVTRVQAST